MGTYEPRPTLSLQGVLDVFEHSRLRPHCTMGNSASHAHYDRHRRRDYGAEDSADPLSPYRPPPMRKQKSLDLPDLASLALSAPGKGHPTTRSAAIAIPNSDTPTERPLNKLMSAELLETTVVRPMRPDYMRRPSQSHYQQVLEEREEKQRSAESSRAPSPRAQSRVPAPVPPSVKMPPMTPLQKAEPVVHSTIPMGLGTKAALPVLASEPSAGSLAVPADELTPTTITWHGGGKTVLLARAGDDKWQGRTIMDQDPDAPEVFHTTIYLSVGTHHIRFLVDDQWRVADDLPTTVDDQGSLANYVDILSATPEPPLISVMPTPLPLLPAEVPVKRHENGYSFWSTAGSSTDYDGNENPYEVALVNGESHYRSKSKWTSEIPQELVEAAHEEEIYLQSQTHMNHSHNGRVIVDGFIPAPSIPPAPGLPRHLDKLILNYRAVNPYHAPSGSPSRGTGRVGRSERPSRSERSSHRDWQNMRMSRAEIDEDEVPVPEIPITTASGTDVSAALGMDGPRWTGREGRQSSTKVGSGHIDAPLADDSSVLPVPSHVVIHHLSTSAIKNGVLAVATTTRYRKKYLTTVYYKPT